MGEAVKRRLLALGLLALLVALAGLGPSTALAQAPAALSDPTRPPASLLQRTASTPAPAAPSTPQLQSVLIARHAGGRQVAVIDGKTVRQGELFNGARLERMTQTEVVLVKGSSVQVLKLFPAAHASAGAAPQR